MNRVKLTFLPLLLLLGCGEKSPPAETKGSSEQVEAPKSAAGKGTPTVRLLSAGKDPKVPLRLKVEKGATESAVMTMTMGMEMTMGVQAFPSPKMPPMQLTMDIEITDVAADGDVTYSFKISEAAVVDDPEVMAAVKEAMEEQLQNLVGLSGNARVTNRGITKDAKVDFPPGIDPQARQVMESMKDSIHQFGAPYPVEPVGEGATWEVLSDITANGLTLKQVANFELVALAPDGGTAKVTITQRADPQVVSPPGMPPGATMHLKEMNSNGGGETTFAFGRVVPPACSCQMESLMKAKVEAEGQTQDMTVKMNLLMEMAAE